MSTIMFVMALLLWALAAADLQATGTSSNSSSINSANSFERLVRCLRGTSHLSEAAATLDALRPLPPAQLQAHHAALLVALRAHRNVPVHSSAGYHGPWLENHFIAHFLDRPLDTFAGMVPLFVQWTDIHVHSMPQPAGAAAAAPLLNASRPRDASLPVPPYTTLFASIAKLLRPDVIYFAVSQDDDGLSTLTRLRPNVLSLSAGGYGHVALPLVKGELAYVPPPPLPSGATLERTATSFAQLVGFYGQVRPRLARYEMLVEVASLLPRGMVRVGQTEDWKRMLGATLFNLAPRGYGRTSYRLAEIVQTGRIPVYLYDDYAWLPYVSSWGNASAPASTLLLGAAAGVAGVGGGGKQRGVAAPRRDMAGLSPAVVPGSAADYFSYGLACRRGDGRALVRALTGLGSDSVRAMLERVRVVRRDYTYPGVISQIGEWEGLFLSLFPPLFPPLATRNT